MHKIMMKKMLFTVLVTMLVVLCVGCGKEEPAADTSAAAEGEVQNPDPENPEVADEVSFGSTFRFNGFECTLASEISWHTIAGGEEDADVFAIPFTMKNLNAETTAWEMSHFKVHAPSGAEVPLVGEQFDNPELTELSPGTSLEGFSFYILYMGDGDYILEFNDSVNEPIQITVPVAKK